MIYPSGRAVWAAAAGAIPAFLIALALPSFWYLGLLWICTLLAFLAVDAAAGRGRASLTASLSAPPQVGVGGRFTLHVAASLGGRPRALQARIGHDQRLAPVAGTGGALPANGGTLDLEFDALRRGIASFDRLWLRWRGPFGLIWNQVVLPMDQKVAVLPDVSSARDEAITLLQRSALADGHAQRRAGQGREFESLKDYQPGMGRRMIDWKRSARHSKLLAREFRVEENNNIVLAIDCGRLMCEPVDGVPKVDRAVTAALLSAFIALKGGDLVSLFSFDARPRVSSGAVRGSPSFMMIQKRAAEIDYSSEETNFTLALTTLAAKLDRRSLVIIFTDFVDPISAELMLRTVGRLTERHLVLFMLMKDAELETLADMAPATPEDVARSVTAGGLLRERQVVIGRLRLLGAHVIEADHHRLGPALVERYIQLKEENLLMTLPTGTDAVRQSLASFRQEREADWKAFEALLARVEKRAPRTLSEEELLSLPLLYRSALSSLSVARATSLDSALIAYLEALCLRGYFYLYGARRGLRQRVGEFFLRDWPAAIRDLWRETLVSVGLTVIGAIAGYWLVASDKRWYDAIIAPSLAGGRNPDSSVEALRSVLYDGGSSHFLSGFAAYLFTHNTQVAILAFALGFAFAVPSVLLILMNGCMLGALFQVYASKGLGFELGGWLSIHGTTELFAIALAGAAGMRIGTRIAFPGELTRMAAAAHAGRVAATVMVGVMTMLLFAGLLEGIGRQTITSDATRYAIGGGMLALWICYFYLFRMVRHGNG